MYNPLQDQSEGSRSSVDDQDQLLEKESQDFSTPCRPSLASKGRFIIPVLVTIATTLSAFVLGTWFGSQKFAHTNREYLEHIQKYCMCPPTTIQSLTNDKWIAPILKEVDTSLHPVLFNGSFMKENEFRKDAGPEVDAAWESIGVNCKLPLHFLSSRF